MSKKIQNATKTAKKVQKISAKKVIRQDEPKPLMTLEEAREVLKRHMAFDTEEGAERVMFDAEKNLAVALAGVGDVLRTPIGDADRGYYPNDYVKHYALRKSAKAISDAVELLIAAETNLNISDF